VDATFKALSDPNRRYLLDLLHREDGQRLSDLCTQMYMTRQAVSQHLALLESANLVTTLRHGREKLHYLNPLPIQEISDRWIHKYARRRVQAVQDLKQRLEEQSDG
jgi:DNA-binding transcriptional ArsR family regulator